MCETRIFMHTFNLNSISQMKKKIFSALLMGVFTLASMSMFVSCKDYDDDINNLDAGQQELLSRIEALEGNVDQKLPEIESSLATAVENANKALQGVEDAQGLINEVKTTAEAAGAAATGAQEDADAAKAVADEALEKAEAALEALGVTEDGTSLVEKVNDLAEQLGTLQSIANNIPTLIEEAQKATNEELAKISAEVDKYQSLFDNLFAMLTSVELYGTFNGQGIISWAYGTANDVQLNKNLKLAMVHGNVGSDSKFGDNEALKIDDKTIFATATPEITFVKGTDIKVNEGIIVRVNPVNAKITGDNVAIKVINSLGKDMNDYIKVASVEPYADIITRGGQINSGLYKINFEWVDGVNMDAYNAAVKDPVLGVKDVLFAVAINNTDTVQADRYVASTYDLALGDEAYTPANVLSFKVDNTPVTDIKNRWDGTKANAGDADEPLKGDALEAVERVWEADNDDHPTPATAITDNNTKKADAATDGRSGKPYLPVDADVPFTVALADLDATTVDDNPNKIQYYYVTFDENFAGSSAPSELAAWKSYGITGLYTVTDASKSLKITIPSTALAEVGDKIGFRVYAVNYDGTLVDPDGRAFYVAVGKSVEAQSVDVDIKVSLTNKTGIAALPKDFKFADTQLATSGTNATALTQEDFDKDGLYSTSDARIGYQLYKDKDGKDKAENWNEAKYISVWYNDVLNFVDNGTVSFTIKAEGKVDGVDRVVNILTVNVTKVMPTVADLKYSRKDKQVIDGTYTCYVDPSNGKWVNAAVTADNGMKDLTTFANNVTTNYVWTFANALRDGDKDKDLVVKNSTMLYVANRYIDGNIETPTSHATTVDHNWGKISLVWDNNALKEKDYVLNVDKFNTVFACALNENVMEYSWGQYKNDLGDGKFEMVDVNYIYYGGTQVAPEYLKNNENIGSFLVADNAYDTETFSYKSTLTGYNIWLGEGIYNEVSAKLISNESKESDYFKVDVVDRKLNFTPLKTDAQNNPKADVPSTLVITAKDIFGHTNTYELPFTVLPR